MITAFYSYSGMGRGLNKPHISFEILKKKFYDHENTNSAKQKLYEINRGCEEYVNEKMR
jgi:hypothetical protein